MVEGSGRGGRLHKVAIAALSLLSVFLFLLLLAVASSYGDLESENRRLRDELDRLRDGYYRCEGRLAACERDREKLALENARLNQQLSDAERNVTRLREQSERCARELESAQLELHAVLGSLARDMKKLVPLDAGYVHWIVLAVPPGYRLRISFSFASITPITIYLLDDVQWAAYWRDGIVRDYIAYRRGMSGGFNATLKPGEERVAVYYIAFMDVEEDTFATITLKTTWERE